MKNLKKIFSVIVAVFLLATMALPASAATQSYTGTPGQTVNVYFTYDGVFSIDTPEALSISDPNGIVAGVKYSIADNGGLTGTMQDNKVFLFDASNSSTGHRVSICAAVTLKSTAAVGSKCTVKIVYNLSTDVEGKDIISGAETSSVTVVKQAGTKPTEPTVKIDYSALNAQIKAAEALDPTEYTASTWAPLADALANAKGRLTSKDQAAVNKAAQALKDAIAALEKVDYTKLEEAIAAADALLKDNYTDEKLEVFFNALNTAKATLSSQEQTDIDAAAEALQGAVDALKEVLEDPKGLTPINPLPDYDYCNIRLHKIYQIVMWISILLNLAFIALFIWLFTKKNGKRFR